MPDELNILFIYPNILGPYHVERLKAFQEIAGVKCVVWEVQRRSALGYKWKINRERYPFLYRYTTPVELLRRGISFRNNRKPDVIVIHGWDHLQTILFGLWMIMTGVAVFVQSESYGKSVKRHWWLEFCKRSVLRCFTGFLVAGPQQAEYLKGLLGARRTIAETRYMALAPEPAKYIVEIDTCPARLGSRILKRDEFFLCVCRLLPFKRVEIILKGYAEYLKRAGGKHAELLVVLGDGPEQCSLEVCCEILDIRDKVVFGGFVEGVELRRFYRDCTAFIQAGQFDCHPMVVTEALMHGAPCILTNTLGNTYLVEESGAGIIVDPPESSGISDALMRLANDECERAKMRRKGREYAWAMCNTKRSALLTIEQLRPFAKTR